MKKSLFPLLVLSFTASAAFAAGNMQPGLWEMSMKSEALKNLPKIPPQQIEQLRRMGIEVPKIQEGGMVTRVCISKAMAERDEPPAMAHKEMGCESRNFQRSGNTFTVDVVCSGKDLQGQGQARGTFQNNRNFTSTYDFQGTLHGQPVNQHHDGSGKWLSADCGSVKPMDETIQR